MLNFCRISKMSTITIFFVIISMTFTSTESINHGDFISITSAPYFVSFVATAEHKPYCGGAIISDYWILSAGHCILITRVLPSAVPMQIRAGSSHRTGNGDIHEVEKVFIYGNYENNIHISERGLGYDDIALFKLKTPIAFNEYKQPIKVNSQLPNNLGTVTIVGIGSEGANKHSESLKTATFADYPLAMKELSKAIPSVLVIRGFGPEVCPGDSGSPAVFNGEVIGVLSGGPPCAEWKSNDTVFKGTALYTRTDMFYDWIMQLTGIKY